MYQSDINFFGNKEQRDGPKILNLENVFRFFVYLKSAIEDGTTLALQLAYVMTSPNYDSQFSMALGKFGDKVSAFKLPCCQGQLPLFPRLTFRALTSRAMSPPKSTNGNG